MRSEFAVTAPATSFPGRIGPTRIYASAMTRRVLALIAAATAAASLIVVPSASAADHPDKVTVFLQQTVREQLDEGATGVTVGDIVTGSGTLSRTKGGASIGEFVYRAETVRVNRPGALESRLSTQWYDLPKGAIMTSALISIHQGVRPTRSQKFVILGGTGSYIGAQGVLTFMPLGPDDYRATFDFVG